MVRKLMATCEGRHDIPQAVDGAVFPMEISDPTNGAALEATAKAKLQAVDSLSLYVTGFTPATLAIVKVCKEQGIALTCYHYDRETGSYWPQVM